jgi:hypothetical protein
MGKRKRNARQLRKLRWCRVGVQPTRGTGRRIGHIKVHKLHTMTRKERFHATSVALPLWLRCQSRHKARCGQGRERSTRPPVSLGEKNIDRPAQATGPESPSEAPDEGLPGLIRAGVVRGGEPPSRSHGPGRLAHPEAGPVNDSRKPGPAADRPAGGDRPAEGFPPGRG